MAKEPEHFCLDREDALRVIEKLLPSKDDCFLSDLYEDIQRPPAKTIGERRDIVVTIRPGLDANDIELIQAVEKAMDEALLAFGHTRSKSVKWGHKVEFVYYQFASCGVSELDEVDDDIDANEDCDDDETEEQTT